MTIMEIAAGASLVVAAATVIGFWMNFSDRITKADARAAAAEIAAKDSSGQVAILSASFSLYRENVAKEYIHRETMHEVEDRLTQAINRLGDRLDKILTKDA